MQAGLEQPRADSQLEGVELAQQVQLEGVQLAQGVQLEKKERAEQMRLKGVLQGSSSVSGREGSTADPLRARAAVKQQQQQHEQRWQQQLQRVRRARVVQPAGGR